MKNIKESNILMLLDNPFLSDVRVHKEAITLINNNIKVTILCTVDSDLTEEEQKDGILIHRKIRCSSCGSAIPMDR